jgi:hypothetical protein
MTKNTVTKEDMAQGLWAWFLDHAKNRDNVANEIGFEFSLHQPREIDNFTNEFGMLHLFMVNRAVFMRFENAPELGQEIINLFFKNVFSKLPTDSIEIFIKTLQERTAQYDKLVGLSGSTMFASTFIGNVFGDPMSGMTFKAIPLQTKLLASISSLEETLQQCEIVNN